MSKKEQFNELIDECLSYCSFDAIVDSKYYDYKDFIYEELERLKISVDDPCIDNFRIAEKEDSIYVDIYMRLASKGCCGFLDEEIVAKDGMVFLIGFNYGH